MAGDYSQARLGGRTEHFQLGSGSTNYFNTYANERSMAMLHEGFQHSTKGGPEAKEHHYTQMAIHAKKGARAKRDYKPEGRTQNFTQAKTTPSKLKTLYN